MELVVRRLRRVTSKPFIMSGDIAVPEKWDNFPIPGVSNSAPQKLTSFLGWPRMRREQHKGENI